MDEITKIAIFRQKEIRRIIYKNEWWFSVIDVIEALTGSDRPRKYWSDLKKKLVENKGKVMCVVAYAGDSRTMTVDNFGKVAEIVKSVDPNIWLHADACHGFSLGFSNNLRHMIKGIEQFDSISLDPHKVLVTPYVISTLLVKDPKKLAMSMANGIREEEV